MKSNTNKKLELARLYRELKSLDKTRLTLKFSETEMEWLNNQRLKLLDKIALLEKGSK